jgi:putative membrane protein
MPLTLRILTRVLLLAALTIAPAAAHVEELVTPGGLWSEWSFEPLILLFLAATSWLYGRGVRRLWAKAGRGRGVPFACALSFAGGQAALIVALISPLDALGGTLLSAHMAQHGLLAGVAPPLLVLGRPDAAFAWALTPFWTSGGLAPVWRLLSRLERALSTPGRATVLLGITMWLWHAPALFGAAVAHDWIHAVQHLSFFIPALLFWRGLFHARSVGRVAGAAAAAFITFMHTGLLGALITTAPEPLYSVYVGRTGSWGLSALADQQLAGLLMWVPMGVPYVAAGLLLGARVFGGDDDKGVEPGSSVPIGSSAEREGAI